MSKEAKQRYSSKRELYSHHRMGAYLSRSKLSAAKAVGLMVPIVLLFYLVLYLKEIGLDYQSYFSNYENAVVVWAVGFDFFKTILNTLDSITSVLGKILEFIINSVDAVITFVVDRINTIQAVTSGTWFANLAKWWQNLLIIKIF